MVWRHSMRSDVAESLHQSVSDNGSGIDWEWSHHANQVSLVESLKTMSFVAVTETLHGCFVFWISEFVGLHQGFDIVEGIIEGPVSCSSDTSSDKGNIHWQIFLVSDSGWGEGVGDLFDCCEEKCQTGCLSDGWCSLTSIESLNSVLSENLHNCVKWSWVHFFSLTSLNLNSNTSVFDGALLLYKTVPEGMN